MQESMSFVYREFITITNIRWIMSNENFEKIREISKILNDDSAICQIQR